MTTHHHNPGETCADCTALNEKFNPQEERCLLCTSPVPSDREDANYAYLAGYADGMLFKARGERRSMLCAEHSAKLVDILNDYGLTLEGGGIPPRPIPEKASIEAFIHCVKCLHEKPQGKSPAQWARLNFGFTELGVQVWCERHHCNVIHIDFQGHQHPASSKAG